MYDLYYFIPWPQCQMLHELDKSKRHWAYADSEFEAGCFVEKEWWDTNYK